MAALCLTGDAAVAASGYGRIAPPEPPGIEPLPIEPDGPVPPETEPLRPDTDEPGVVPEEFPQWDDGAALHSLRCT
jgi:hypothetical protein